MRQLCELQIGVEEGWFWSGAGGRGGRRSWLEMRPVKSAAFGPPVGSSRPP
jgi:hypothetical protein